MSAPNGTQFAVKAGSVGVSVSITDSFNSAGKFEKPWLTPPTRGAATLHVGTKKASGLFNTSEELTRQVTLHVARSRIPKGTVLYIYNDDNGEVIGHAIAP